MNDIGKNAVYLGMDLGGTKLAYVAATGDGDFLHQKIYPSPYRVVSEKLENGESAVYMDTIMKDIPLEKRVSQYLQETETDFLKEAGIDRVSAKGMSLCGKTWVDDGNILMIGGNTPERAAVKDNAGRSGIRVGSMTENVVAANDGNAAATAQGIHYQARKGIPAVETGYIILGTGFGLGIPGFFATTEIGHIPIPLMPEALWQGCGCNRRRITPCAENYASGRGIAGTAERLLELHSKGMARDVCEKLARELGRKGCPDFDKTSLVPGEIKAETVMGLAQDKEDELAVFIADLAAHVTAYCAVAVAYQFGLQRMGLGEAVAVSNPWHVDRIARIATELVGDSTILMPPLVIEPTPVREPGRYGALSLVIPEDSYELWAEKMGL